MTSKLCLQMFIGCGGTPQAGQSFTYWRAALRFFSASSRYPGLNVLVDLVASAEDLTRSSEAKKLVMVGIDCIVLIFTHLDIRRNDFCRLFAKLGLLPYLSVAFTHMFNRYVKQGRRESSLHMLVDH
jgi:hypothetical protein